MFKNKDQVQEMKNKKFAETVLTDYSRRRRHKEAITDNKPAYYDKLQNDFQSYLGDKESRIKDAWEFQKSRIDQKYREMNQVPTLKTKMGEESYQHFQKYQEEVAKSKSDMKDRQSTYAQMLKQQVNLKKDALKKPELDKMNTTYLGKYKLSRNASLPMIPGIHSTSSLTGMNPLQSYTHKFKGTRVSKGPNLGSSPEKISVKTGGLGRYTSDVPNSALGLGNMKVGSRHF